MLYKKAYEALNQKYLADEEQQEEQRSTVVAGSVHNYNNVTTEILKTRNSHQNLDNITERANQSYLPINSDDLHHSHNNDEYGFGDHYHPFKHRMHSIDVNHGKATTTTSVVRDFFRRRSFDITNNQLEHYSTTGFMSEINHNALHQQTQQSHNSIIIQGNNRVQRLPGNNANSNNELAGDISAGQISASQLQLTTPKKQPSRPADRKSILSHFSQHSNNSHETQGNNNNLLALSMLKGESIKLLPGNMIQLQKPMSQQQQLQFQLPSSQQQQSQSQQVGGQQQQGHQLQRSNNLKSVQFVNPGQMRNKDIYSYFETEAKQSQSGASSSVHSLGFDRLSSKSNEKNKPINKAKTLNDGRLNLSAQTSSELHQLRETEDSKIGQQLAQITINRVIVMVFALFVCIPFFDETNYIVQDDQFDTNTGYLQTEYDNSSTLLNLEVEYTIQQGMKYDSSDSNYRYPLMKLTVANNVMFPTVQYPYDQRQFKNLRDDEITVVQYYSSNNSNLLFEEQYVIKLDQDLAAYLSICQTTFIIVILAYATISFTKNIQKIVVSPIERMLENIKHIADNPLLAAKMSEEKAMAEQELKKNQVQYMELSQQRNDETYLLESTIMKIGALLAIGFGEAGSKIITKNMRAGSKVNRIGGRIDPMVPGKKMMAIFGFCSIKNFSDATEILQEKVMIFANEIAELVHICCDSFHGAINKNLGDCFLLVWKFTEDQSQLFLDANDSVRLANQPLVQNLSDLPIIAFLKTIANIRMLSLTPSFVDQHLKPLRQVMPTFKLRLGFGLHVGWGIEGAIGSFFKIDASYLSPNVNMASRLENATKQYGLYFLISGSLYRLLSQTTQSIMRHVDRVTVKGSKQPMDLYTCDVNPLLIKECNNPVKQAAASEASENGGEINKKVLKYISRKHRSERYKRILNGSAQISRFLETDADIVTMRQHYTEEFRDAYHDALHEYFEGDWEVAKDLFEQAQGILRENIYRTGEDDSVIDGPTQTLMNFMSSHNFKPPSNWFGYRVLVDK